MICKYVISSLYEYWTDANDDIVLPNYTTVSTPREHGKGRGIAIFIRDCIEKVCDSIVILKIEPRRGRDIPPINSSYYNTSDIDLFIALKDSITNYYELGNILAIGDFNSRTGTWSDFILNDRCCYSPDVDIAPVCRKRLILCKTTGLRILNGRHSGDRKGNITFYNANGSSLID